MSDPEYPEWGSWGGRYGPVNYGDGHYADSTDLVAGSDGIERATSQGTVWRWRKHYQNDFAARMQWTVTDSFEKANHAPVAVINDQCGLTPLKLDLQPGGQLVLDAAGSYDPDGDTITFKWWQYREPSIGGWSHTRFVPNLHFDHTDREKITVSLPSRDELLKLHKRIRSQCLNRQLHVILEVSDGKLVSYRRVVISFEVCQDEAETENIAHQEL